MAEERRAGDAGEAEDPVFLVRDENGTEREMVPACTFECEGNEYVVLIDRNDGEADGLILRLEQNGGEIVLANIEDDGEWDAVVRTYEAMLDAPADE